jgi:cellobiose-specific phosphotransferase system component IIA
MLYQLSYGHQAHARFYQEKAGGKTLSMEALMVADE